LELSDLLARTANGDKAAFSALYSELETPLYRFARSRLNDPFEAADLVHEVLLEVWRSAGRFEGRSSVKSWVFGIAYRKAMDVYRKTSRIDYSDNVPEVEDQAPTAEACLLAAQKGEHVQACLETLKPDHRMAIEFAFFEDMSYKEISMIADVPEGTIKTRVHHAKKLLLHCLSSRLGKGAV